MFDLNWLCPEVRAEYERWLAATGDDPYASAITLGIHDVLKAHFLIANHFYLEGEALGGIGPRDLNLKAYALPSGCTKSLTSTGRKPRGLK